jgi:PBSX family phage terminase large subunit
MNLFKVPICYPVSELNPDGDPLPTQTLFHDSGAKIRMLAGGWGTGKTTAGCLEMCKDIAYPFNYILLGRKDLQELKATTLKEFLDIYETSIINHNKQDRVITFNNGTEVYYTNLDESREAIKKIQSLNLGAAFIDQAEELTEKMFIAITGRLRRQNSRRCFYGAMNPAGHDWIYRRFVIQKRPLHEIFTATTLENKYLPPDYIESLLDMPDNWVKRYVYCSFDDFEGMVFNQFTEKLNVIDYYEPTSDNQHIHILDYGYRNPSCILFAATDYDGITTVYNEYYQAGKLVSEISEEYKHNMYWQKAIKHADPSIHKTERDGNNVFNDFLKEKIFWDNADNNVSQGINAVNELFKAGKLRITKNCVNTITEIGEYKWKELKPGLVRNEYEEPVKKNDHACDCLRYLANYILQPADNKPKPKLSEREQARYIYTHTQNSDLASL